MTGSNSPSLDGATAGSTPALDVFALRDSVVGEYKRFATSFTTIHAPDIREQVEGIYAGDRYWPEPLIQINPSYKRSTDVGALAASGVLTPSLSSRKGTRTLLSNSTTRSSSSKSKSNTDATASSTQRATTSYTERRVSRRLRRCVWMRARRLIHAIRLRAEDPGVRQFR